MYLFPHKFHRCIISSNLTAGRNGVLLPSPSLFFYRILGWRTCSEHFWTWDHFMGLVHLYYPPLWVKFPSCPLFRVCDLII